MLPLMNIHASVILVSYHYIKLQITSLFHCTESLTTDESVSLYHGDEKRKKFVFVSALNHEFVDLVLCMYRIPIVY